MRHIYDFKKITVGSSPLRRRTKSNYGRKDKILLVIFFIIVGGWAYTFYFSPLFAINSVQIDGLEKISKSSVLELLNADGSNIFRFNVIKAKKAVQDTHFIEDITIKKVYPNSITIKITEKHPAFEFSMSNYKYLLDGGGLVVKVEQSSSTLRSAENLPLLLDPNDRILTVRERAISEKEIEAIVFSLNNLKTENNITVVKTVLNKAEPEVITFKTAEDFDIIISHKEDIPTKLFKLSSFLQTQGEKRK